MTQALLLRPHEFSQDVGVVYVDRNQTLRQMLQQACGDKPLDCELSVRVGGYEVPVAYWHRLRPKEGAAIHITRRSLHGNGVKQIIAVVAMIALTYFTAGIASGAFLSGTAITLGVSSATLATAVSMLGMLAISALTKPSMPGGSSGTQGQWNQLTGTQNQISPWGVIPLVIGESRFFPTHAAIPYSEAVGESSYQYCMFDLGHGELEVSDIKIGDTPISDYAEVQYEITKTTTLYTADVAEVSVGATMEDGDDVTRTTSAGVTRISLDLVYSQGLYWVSTSSKDNPMFVEWKIEYRAVGSGTWLAPADASAAGMVQSGATFTSRALRKKPFAAGVSWPVPAGQYEVRVTRVASDYEEGNKNTFVHSTTWSVLRSIKLINPSTTGTTKLCLRIKASDQLTGTLQTLSCFVQQKIPVYDRDTGTWSAPQVCTNAAWVTYWLMTSCPALSRHVNPNRIHLDVFADYAEFCDANSFEVRSVQDSPTTAWELIEGVLSCSLGSLSKRDGRYSVVFDAGETLPSMTFTPLETKEFTVSRSYTRRPHALRVQFKNPEANWQEDEIIVLDDGYSYRGVDARGVASELPEPAEFETMRLQYAADSIHAWRVGRYHFAQAKFRPNNYSFATDVAGLRTVRGDVVDVFHDVTEWGVGVGRVVSLTAGGYGGAAATLVLDQDIATEAGKAYRVQIRRSDGTAAVVALMAAGGETNTFLLAAMPSGVYPGDGVAIGETAQEVAKLLITGASSSNGGCDHAFSAVAYDARVAPYWADPPASIISEISGMVHAPIPVPDVTGVVTNPEAGAPDDAGILAPVVRIGVGNRPMPRDDILEALM